MLASFDATEDGKTHSQKLTIKRAERGSFSFFNVSLYIPIFFPKIFILFQLYPTNGKRLAVYFINCLILLETTMSISSINSNQYLKNLPTEHVLENVITKSTETSGTLATRVVTHLREAQHFSTIAISSIARNLHKVALPTIALLALSSLPGANGGGISYGICVAGCQAVALAMPVVLPVVGAPVGIGMIPNCLTQCLPLLTPLLP